MRYLTFALAKGRLAKKTLQLFEQIGITCEEMKDPDTRKLIFVNEELKLRFFLAKGPDVPTYVEYGAADIGVVGKDTILEEGRKVHEVLDLGYGKCKMCVCGYKDAAPLLQHHELIRVATKYPNIAKDYFQFAEWEYIESELTRLLSELKSENFLDNLTKEKFAERLAYYWAELNVLHPFREGNGRTTREFLRQLSLKNGYILNLHKISPQKLFNASIKSIIDTADLEKYLYACLEK